MLKRFTVVLTLVLLIAGLAPAAQAQQAVSQSITGAFSIAYSGYESLPLLVGVTDASGLFGRDPVYLGPKDQQMLGTYKGDASNGSYTAALLDRPRGRGFDVTTGSTTPNADLLIFDVRLMSDAPGRGYMSTNEDAIASSLKIDVDFSVVGGSLLVWTANDKQPFPTDAGADGKLFTADDPRVTLPAGWSQIVLDEKPFKIQPVASEINLITTGTGDVIDYRSLSCAELVPTFLDRVQKNYPFTALHKVDWAAIRAKLIPASKTAQTPADCQQLIRDFGNAVPDGHVNFNLPALRDELAGSPGFRLASTSDGKVVVILVRADSPADKAGVKVGAVITEWDGKPIKEALDNLLLQFSNSSTPHGLLNVKLTQLPLGKLGSQVSITFRNPGESAKTATIERVQPQRAAGIAKRPPEVTDNKLPSGIGYIRIDSFTNGRTLTQFDRIVDQLIKDNVPGIIIDVRSNPGGFSQLSDAMSSRFFDKGFIVGKQYAADGRLVYQMVVDPRPPIYTGKVAILVDVNTASSGDLFAYTFKSGKRAIIVGQTPSSGMAGTVSGGQYRLPDGAFIQVPTGGFVDDTGKTAIEGEGVVPDVLVPTTVESLLSPEDAVLNAAVEALQQELQPAR
ncbi:MAG: PDZ domain-containing protein [Anaerolineae bacterium]|nr:PDZ domain-containing protein [Anaerolineae bacterium]